MFDLEPLPVGELTNRGDDCGDPTCPVPNDVKNGSGAIDTSSSSEMEAEFDGPRDDTDDKVGLDILGF